MRAHITWCCISQATQLQLHNRCSSSNRSNAFAMTGTLTTVVENTTAGALKLKETETEGELLFPAIDVNDRVMKFKFDDVSDCYFSISDNIMRESDAAIGRKRALVCSQCDEGEGCNFDLRDSGECVFLVYCDPICAIQAYIEALQLGVGRCRMRPLLCL